MSLIKNYFYNMLLRSFQILFPLILIPYTTRILGPEYIGRVNFAQSIGGYFIMLAMFGMPLYASREIARNNQPERRYNLFMNFIIIQVFASVIAASILMVVVFSVHSLHTELLLYSSQIFVVLFCAFDITWFFQGIEQYDKVTKRVFISKIFYLLSVFVLVHDQNDYVIFAYLNTIAVLVQNLYYFYSLRIYKKATPSFQNIKTIKITISEIILHLKKIIVFFVSTISYSIYASLNITILGIISGNIAVGLYSVAGRLISITTSILTSVNSVNSTRISYCIGKKDYSQIERNLYFSSKGMLMFSIPIVTAVVLLKDQIVLLLFGKQFIPSAIVLGVLSLQIIFAGLSGIFGSQVLIPFNLEKKYTLVMLYACIVSVPLNILLIKEFGILGAAISSIVIEAFICIFMYQHSKKYLNKIYFVKNILFYLIGTGLFILPIIAIKHFFSNNLLCILSSAVIGAIVYSTYLFIFKDEVFRLLIDMVRVNLLKRGGAHQ